MDASGGNLSLAQRTRAFAVRIIKLYEYLRDVRHETTLSKQILRSGTSIGANVAEGTFGASKADFINKYSIALKEANETNYWLAILGDTGYLPPSPATESLLAECKELVAILAASVKTAKSNPRDY